MALNLIVFAGFYSAARNAAHYADTLGQALGGKVVLLHVNRAGVFDPYAYLSEDLRQQELELQTDTAAALYRQAETLHCPTEVEVTTDLLPVIAQDLAHRYHPALFVMGQADASPSAPANLLAACAELLRAGHQPLLVVPAGAAPTLPRRVLIAADREPFALAPAAQPLRQLLARLAPALVVAHVSSGGQDDAGCGAALHAVQVSGLVSGLPTPELRGYEHDHSDQGLLAAVQDTRAELMLVLARQRSYLSDLFHRSVTAQLLEHCPVPVLVLPTTDAPANARATPISNALSASA
ncbi:universal stress protein [Hymenobacter persicinus]|uniref:UspA domain-containing protein n=1 Tax=Hymenobacter persicinus TaxID=2025506 RepID=A0A4Q5L6V2_9BACT|nr:universal stress protein [Hymenobacter persicinus]RYU76037.1 hypothetical protein EWM57_19250 [Hymenobacter persicinus]